MQPLYPIRTMPAEEPSASAKADDEVPKWPIYAFIGVVFMLLFFLFCWYVYAVWPRIGFASASHGLRMGFAKLGRSFSMYEKFGFFF